MVLSSDRSSWMEVREWKFDGQKFVDESLIDEKKSVDGSPTNGRKLTWTKVDDASSEATMLQNARELRGNGQQQRGATSSWQCCNSLCYSSRGYNLRRWSSRGCKLAKALLFY